MHRSETENLMRCSDCGVEFQPASERGYTFGVRGALCWDCAERRGGRYDDLHETWVNPPNLKGLSPETD